MSPNGMPFPETPLTVLRNPDWILTERRIHASMASIRTLTTMHMCTRRRQSLAEALSLLNAEADHVVNILCALLY